MQIRKTVFPVLFILLALAPAARGQIVYGQPGSANLQFYYNNWSIDNPFGDKDALSQRTIVLSGFMPIKENFEARYFLITGYNDLEMNGVKNDLSGLGDVRLQFSHSFKEDRLLLSGGLNMPTGKKELDTGGDEQIIEFLSRDYLSLPLRRYGQGFGFNLQAGVAAEIGRFKCGVSAVYDYSGSYKPYEGSGDYDPGNAYSLNATANAVLGEAVYTGDIGFSIFGTDDLDGDNIYRQAPQMTARLTATYPVRRYSATFGAMMIVRGRNKRYNEADGAIESQLKKYGDEYDLFCRLGYATSTEWRIGALVGTRQILSSEEELGKSSLLNLGVDIGKSISDRLSLNLGMIYHTGSTGEDAVDIGGLQVSGGLGVTY